MIPTPTPEHARLDGNAAKSPTDALVASGEALQRLGHQAEDIAHQGMAQLRQRGTALHDGTLLQIREHPLRSVLLAAGAGVALTLLIRLLTKH